MVSLRNLLSFGVCRRGPAGCQRPPKKRPYGAPRNYSGWIFAAVTTLPQRAISLFR